MLSSLRNKRILVVVAHPDDEVLGPGATMHRLIKDYGCVVRAVILGEGITSRSDTRNVKEWNEQLEIHKANIETARKYIGYESVGVYDFPDNRFDSVPLLDIVKVIEKEIALIKERKDPRLFLQKIPSLESKKIELENDQTIIRVQAEYEKTPIFNGNKFSAGSFMVGRSKFEIDSISIPKMITISILIALMTGVFYLLIANVFHNKGIVIKRNRR